MKFDSSFMIMSQIMNIFLSSPHYTIINTQDIADKLDTKYKPLYIKGHLIRLAKGGLLKSKRGKRGGYSCHINDISLWSIYKLTDEYKKFYCQSDKYYLKSLKHDIEQAYLMNSIFRITKED